MATIFDDTLSCLRAFVAQAAAKLDSSKRALKKSCFLIIALVIAFTGLGISGATVAYKVSIDGAMIATIRNKQQYADALNIVKERVGEAEVEKAIGEPEYSAAVVHSSVIDSNAVVADAIIETTDSIVSALSVNISGECAVITDDSDVEEKISNYKNSFAVEAQNCTCDFVEQVDVEKVYCLKNELSSEEEVDEVISSLTVVTNLTVVSDSAIPYETIYKNVSTRLRGDKAVVIKGVNGTHRVTEQVTLVNGVETVRTTVSDEVVANPSSAVVEIGTAKSVATEAEKSKAYSSGFIFPLPKNSWRLSSYYGDGRGHKGLDICADKGTSIFAVKGGTVTFSGYDGAYGNSIIIDHGNGLSTRYAHASSLCVSKGESVSAGDVIALVGSTGRSSGNHLHFEVLIGGKQVDPAPYVGLDK